ncbi:hypothetical protein J7T55_003324 [Diaporthe amygdali]|uniref:uncharacterized protein n=1 Tax=Phomopsis amygdali TaxID=1214568 RepID=UPI0022FE1F4F|nr:uncharacterized protein J7T55_003324 [Diaporthe amygdali]KAJ0116910.1 hypothetical protein J7T55_003324 [Diaporthe amygdali]
MAAGAGLCLKLLQWFNRGVQFCCAGLVLALNSYFLAAMSNHSITIPTNLRAVEGISGVAVLYTAIGLLLLCCLAGFTLTSFIAIVLDIAFIGAFIYVATVNKDGASSCSGSNVNTVFGSGDANANIQSPKDGGVPLAKYMTICRMESAILAVSIVAIVFFIVSAVTELALGRHRKKEQRFGPSPANNYTSGYGSRKRGLFGLRRNKRADTDNLADPNALPMHTSPDQVRTSYNTEATRVGEGSPYAKYGEAGYNEHGTATHANTGRYGDGTYNV